MNPREPRGEVDASRFPWEPSDCLAQGGHKQLDEFDGDGLLRCVMCGSVRMTKREFDDDTD